MKDYIKGLSIRISRLDCVLHRDAKFQSFKLTVGVSQFKRLLDSDLWPESVLVHPFTTLRGMCSDANSDLKPCDAAATQQSHESSH